MTAPDHAAVERENEALRVNLTPEEAETRGFLGALAAHALIAQRDAAEARADAALARAEGWRLAHDLLEAQRLDALTDRDLALARNRALEEGLRKCRERAKPWGWMGADIVQWADALLAPAQEDGK